MSTLRLKNKDGIRLINLKYMDIFCNKKECISVSLKQTETFINERSEHKVIYL